VGIFGIPNRSNNSSICGLYPAYVHVFLYRLEKIRVGRAFAAIREDELAADAMGINPTYYKVLAFTGAILQEL